MLKITCSWSDNELALGKDMAITAAEILAAAGAHDIEPFAEDQPPGFAIHEMGTAPMGRDPKASVLNSYNQAHDVRNIFIHRRRRHDFFLVPESVTDLHGADRASL